MAQQSGVPDSADGAKAAKEQVAWQVAASMASAPPSRIQTSIREALPQAGFVLTALALIGISLWVARMTFFETPGTTFDGWLRAARTMPTATALPVLPAAVFTVAPPAVQIVVVTATPTATPVPAPSPIVEIRYVEVPVEVYVDRVVEVAAAVPLPTPTPALGPGTVRLCVWMSGVREVYIGGLGMIPGGCREWVVGVGASYLQVQVNR